jgi:hypothetical protein
LVGLTAADAAHGLHKLAPVAAVRSDARLIE